MDKEEEETDLDAQRKLLKKLRPDGLLNEEKEILRMMDRNLTGDSLVIPAGIKKDGSLTAATSAVSTEGFRQLSGFVSNKMVKMAQEMLDGVTEALPFADRNGSTCDYCQFADVCGFDKKIPEKCRTRKALVNKAEVWELIAREADKQDAEKHAYNEKGGELPWQ